MNLRMQMMFWTHTHRRRSENFKFHACYIRPHNSWYFALNLSVRMIWVQYCRCRRLSLCVLAWRITKEKMLDPSLKYLLSYEKSKKLQYVYPTKKSLKKLHQSGQNFWNYVKLSTRLTVPMVPFCGTASRLFIINCLLL